MHSIPILILALQLPFAAGSSDPFTAISLQSVPSPGADWSSVGQSANEESLRQLLANTKSVMKRRHNGFPAGQPNDEGQSPISDDQVFQAAFNQTGQGAGQGAAGAAKGAGETSGANGSASQPPNANGSQSNEAAAEEEIRAAAEASAALLASALAPPVENALAGRPVSLGEAIGRVANSRQRLEVASLYWKVSLALAEYHWAVDEALQLSSLPIRQGPVDSPLFAAAQAAAQARLFEVKAAAVTAQQELADLMGQPTQALPLTVEQPLVGPYRTEFETLFAKGAAPGRSRAIHRALPHRREAVDVRTLAVQAAASAVAPTEEAYVKDNGRIELVLFAHRELTQQRRAFLNAVREYNAEIVEYASYVAGPNTSTATLMSMLTRSKPAKMSGNSAGSLNGPNQPTLAPPPDSGVQPATALEAPGDDQRRDAGDQAPAIGSPNGFNASDKPLTDLTEIGEGRKD